jgi:hypothetical protein
MVRKLLQGALETQQHLEKLSELQLWEMKLQGQYYVRRKEFVHMLCVML